MYIRTSFGTEVKLASFETPWTRAERLGITAGRKAGSEAEMKAGLKADGLVEGTEEWDQAMRTGREAMKCTKQMRAK